MAKQSRSQHKRTPYQFLKSNVELRLKHAETRRIHEDKTLFEVTKAIYALETSLIPRVGPERMKEFIESYRERGQQAIATLEAANERLESMVEENDVLATYGVDDVDEMIAGLGTRDGEEAKVDYERTAGGQNDVLETLRLHDRACCMVEALTQQGCIDPIERYETIQGYTQTVRQYIRKIQRVFMKANDMADKKANQDRKGVNPDAANEKSDGDTPKGPSQGSDVEDVTASDDASTTEVAGHADQGDALGAGATEHASEGKSSGEAESTHSSSMSHETSQTAL